MKKIDFLPTLLITLLLATSIDAYSANNLPMEQISFNYEKISYQQGKLWLVGEDGKKSLITKNGEYQTVDGQIFTLQNGIVSPRDAASGLATGKRQHKPLVTTQPASSSPAQIPGNITSNDQPQPASMLLPAVQSAREAAK